MKLFSKNEDEFKIFEQTKTENSFLIDSHKTTKVNPVSQGKCCIKMLKKIFHYYKLCHYMDES